MLDLETVPMDMRRYASAKTPLLPTASPMGMAKARRNYFLKKSYACRPWACNIHFGAG
jgi:hypothetical protein